MLLGGGISCGLALTFEPPAAPSAMLGALALNLAVPVTIDRKLSASMFLNLHGVRLLKGVEKIGRLIHLAYCRLKV